MNEIISKKITEVAEKYAAENPLALHDPQEELAIAGRTIAYVAMFDVDGNEVVRLPVPSFVAQKGELVFSNISLHVV